LQGVDSKSGLAMMIARHLAREIATFSRFLLNKKSIFRGISSPLEVAMEMMTTSASWP
jgi:putative flippase GtrA